jgi:prepilin-type processing-associated H-X9-DG protein
MARLVLCSALLLAALTPLGARAAESPPNAAPQAPATVAAPAPAAEAAPLSPVLAYIPDNADLAVLLRVAALNRTELGKKLAAPETGVLARFLTSFPSGMDFLKNVATAAFAYETVWENGQLAAVRSGMALEMTRDVIPADLLTDLVEAPAVEGLDARPYLFRTDSFLVVVSPRLVLVATRNGPQTRDYLPQMVKAARLVAGAPAGPLPVAALDAPGHITFAAHVSPALKDAILAEYTAYQRKVMRPNMDGEQAIQFGIFYNLVRIGIQAEGLTGSLDLARDAEALRADIRFASPQMSPFVVAALQAMADPLQMCLPAFVGGRPLEEPPPEPFYSTTADGPVVRLAMARQAVERLVDRLTASARAEADSAASAENLRTIGRAIQIYVADKGTFPQNWSPLTKTRLLPDAKVFENPGRTEHLDAGDYELVPMTRDCARRNPDLKILAYELWPRDTRPPGLNVLLADGHVEYMEYTKFEQLYRQTLESLGR